MSLELLLPNNITSGYESKENIFNVKYEKGFPFQGFTGQGVSLITSNSTTCHALRNNLANFNNHFRNITIYDLGSIKDLSDAAIFSLTNYLNEFHIIPVFTGINIKFAGALAVENSSKITLISNHLELIEYKNTITNVNHIAYQRHLCSLNDIYEIEENMYNALSLGKMRSHPSLLEPILRDTEVLYVNLDCMRNADAPDIKGCLPTGLNSEELCQIMKNVGTADNLKAVFIDYQLNSNQYDVEANLIAEAIWYFMEGANMNLKDHPSYSSDFSSFIVHSENLGMDLQFIKNNLTAKWWLRHVMTGRDNIYLACSYDEYQLSVGEEVPERLVKFIQAHDYTDNLNS